jgi:hypothetical protein
LRCVSSDATLVLMICGISKLLFKFDQSSRYRIGCFTHPPSAAILSGTFGATRS